MSVKQMVGLLHRHGLELDNSVTTPTAKFNISIKIPQLLLTKPISLSPDEMKHRALLLFESIGRISLSLTGQILST